MITKLKRKIATASLQLARSLAAGQGHMVKIDRQEMYLHNYDSYEQYRDIQIHHNKRKLDLIWADEDTLSLIADRIQKEFGDKPATGICHGSRNGFEQQILAQKLSSNVIGTDISETATQFENTVHWDFHDRNEEWAGKFKFVYTNSLDQSWKPRNALEIWLEQLEPGGLLFVEHTRAHSAEHASEMDPFGVHPKYVPYIFSDWFGHKISIEIMETDKRVTNSGNLKLDKMHAWIFVVKKLE